MQKHDDAFKDLTLWAWDSKDLIWFKHIYLSSVAKQVLETYIKISLSSPLPGTNQYWCHMEKYGRDPSRPRTRDPWVERQTP
jgi:hypothetical protein